MATHLVILNDKYLIAVDANSSGGAEHRILDRIPYEGVVTSCQAFPINEWSSTYFANRAAQCSTMSLDEVETMGAVVGKHVHEAAEAQKEVDRIESNIRELKGELIKQMTRLEAAKNARDKALYSLHVVVGEGK